ncbi:YiaA/YiaB family inner membrane protein [Jiangella anatolica]|uniref:YiaAB two helix domain-containing protein n=1 Tax=Jiangella anatolica TaxID=2670374 RepID=A0A2W2C304_9ACTN|nr:YiaA/YiaB family inner membrane protein [Jiangella anatolica]PZF86448.1 hypothetical protein C1I92_01155 [Jiangella anatolica]
MTTAPPTPRTTTAFYVQAILSFAIALVTVVVGILYLDIDSWTRAFLGLGTLYLVTSAFTLAKCIRDQQEDNALTKRLDQARVDKLIAEHDPFREPV